MDLELRDRVVLVSGGSSGLGLATARLLVLEGARVGVIGRSRDRVEHAVADLARTGGTSCHGAAGDIRSLATARSLARQVATCLGPPDVLLNCAATPGAQLTRSAEVESTADEMAQELSSKLGGYLNMIRAVLPDMLTAGHGRVVNVGGADARRAGSLPGSVRNAAVASMTKNLADEYADRGTSFVTVHPGAMDQDVRPRPPTISTSPRVPIGRVASLVAFLCSPLSEAVNGDVVMATGGVPGAIHL